jgi:hypothetical protein
MQTEKQHIALRLVNADAVSFEADVLVLKYAQNHYGLDRSVSQKGTRLGIDAQDFAPLPGICTYFTSRGVVAASMLLVVGVTALSTFGYREIRQFARTSLEALAKDAPSDPISHICLTLHGAEYGLDEIEAFEAEVAGLIDSITAGRIPGSLREISIVEIDKRRSERLQSVLHDLIPRGYVETSLNEYLHSSDADVTERFRSAGYSSHEKPSIFVAMPFKHEMDDVYEYGFQVTSPK